MRVIVLFLATLVLGFTMQQPPEQSYHDTLKETDPEYNMNPNETRIPPGHYCVQREVFDYNQSRARRSQASAHPCDCKMACVVDTDEDGTPTEETRQEQPDCMSYCHLNGRRCTCHEEEPCPGSHPGANALVDMDGHVVAVLR